MDGIQPLYCMLYFVHRTRKSIHTLKNFVCNMLRLSCSEYQRFCINLVKYVSFIVWYSLLLHPIKRVITAILAWQGTAM
jgi:hypothetical protein